METRDSTPIDVFARLEPLLLFLVFYLPGYLAEAKPISGRVFNSLTFNLTYLVEVVPRIALLLYLIVLRSRIAGRSTSPAAALRSYGIGRIRASDLGWIVLAFAAIEIVVVPLSMLATYLEGVVGAGGHAALATTVHWRLTNPAMLPFVLLTSLTVGYSEELYFRSYLLTTLPSFGVGVGAAVTASTALFALGHIYEGLPGIVGTAAIGVLLSLAFLWKRNLHIIAIAHALYNFVTLLATLSPGTAHL